jgi:hypothetical protein
MLPATAGTAIFVEVLAERNLTMPLRFHSIELRLKPAGADRGHASTDGAEPYDNADFVG